MRKRRNLITFVLLAGLCGAVLAGQLGSSSGTTIARDAVGTATGLTQSPNSAVIFGHVGQVGAALTMSPGGISIAGGVPGAFAGAMPVVLHGMRVY